MLLLDNLLLHLLVSGTLVAPVFSLQLNFTSVRQCAPILFSFSELSSNVIRAPVSLTLLPFNSTAIVVPLPNSTFSTGISLNSLPFTASSQFIASLDDVDGNNIIDISDSITVLPSLNNDSSCVPNEALPKSFILASPVVSQCQNFTINYNTNRVSQAPSVRLYSPDGPSLLLDVTSDNNISGVATYTMAFPYGRSIVLLMDNKKGIKETTALLTVGGDSSSSNACLSAHSTGTLSSGISAGISSRSSWVIAIVGATVGGFAILLGFCLAIFVLWDHRRRHRTRSRIDLNDKEDTVHHAIVSDDRSPIGFVINPVDTLKSFLLPKKAVYDRNSLASWSQAIPEDQRHPTPPKPSPSPADYLSEQSLDIEGMLNTLQPDTIVNKRRPDPVVLGSPMVPQPALLQSPMIFRHLSDRHLRAPSDVPADLNSRTCSVYSTVSMNPGGGVNVTESSSCRAPIIPGGRSIKGGFVGLPSSPRDPRANIRGAASKRGNTNIAEWHGRVTQ